MDTPRVFCDFNKRYTRTKFGLNTAGTQKDLERLELSLTPGLRLTLYDYDGFENGDPAWLLADAVVVDDPDLGLVADVEPDSFRWEPRTE